MNDETRLLLAILNKQVISEECLLNIDYDFFYKLIIRHRLAQQIIAHIQELGLNLPTSFITQLIAFCNKDKLAMLTTVGETIRISKAFKNIRHCFLKGPIISQEVYANLTARTCRDLDIWVTPEDFDAAVAILLELGYVQDYPSYELHGFKKEFYLKRRHDIAYIHPQRNILVELHFKVNYFGVNFFDFTSEHQRIISINNQLITTLENDYHVLYLMIHGAIHAWTRLRWIYDIFLFIQQDKCNLDNLYNIAKQINCQHFVIYPLIIIKQLFNYSNFQMDLLIANSSNTRCQGIAETSLKFIYADYELTEGKGAYDKMFFIYRIYLVRIAVKDYKLKALIGDLFKLDKMFPYVTLPKYCSWGYYLLYPIWIVKYLIKRE